MKILKKGAAPKPAQKSHGSAFTYAATTKTSAGADVSNKKKK